MKALHKATIAAYRDYDVTPMKEAVRLLLSIFRNSFDDLAVIFTAEAENDKETILKYLANVKEYTEELIEKVKNNE